MFLAKTAHTRKKTRNFIDIEAPRPVARFDKSQPYAVNDNAGFGQPVALSASAISGHGQPYRSVQAQLPAIASRRHSEPLWHRDPRFVFGLFIMALLLNAGLYFMFAVSSHITDRMPLRSMASERAQAIPQTLEERVFSFRAEDDYSKLTIPATMLDDEQLGTQSPASGGQVEVIRFPVPQP